MKTLVAFIVLLTAYTQPLVAQNFPENAVPGKCYYQCMTDDVYERITTQIMLKESSFYYKPVPAIYDTIKVNLMIREGYTTFILEAAQWAMLTDSVLINPARNTQQYTPPIYQTINEQVLVKPATTKWIKKPNSNACLAASTNTQTCLIWCLINQDAEYKTISKKVLSKPASLNTITIPAGYKTITRAVLQKPATVSTQTVAPEYRTIDKLVLKQKASLEKVEIEAEYSTVSSKALTKKGGLTQWTEVICHNGGVNPQNFIKIKNALKLKGYYNGPMDNILNKECREALIKFPKDHHLPVGNLNKETLAALGISID
jgi:phosphopantothenoylcysteine synthetase/decarboxylase